MSVGRSQEGKILQNLKSVPTVALGKLLLPSTGGRREIYVEFLFFVLQQKPLSDSHRRESSMLRSMSTGAAVSFCPQNPVGVGGPVAFFFLLQGGIL